MNNKNNDSWEHPFTQGSEVYIVERDECEDACEVSGYMLVAYTKDAVIVSAFINGLRDLETTIEYHIKETASNFDTDLCVFPLADCYSTKEEADSALERELNE